MDNKDIEKNYKKEIDQLKDFFEEVESHKSPDLDQIRTFVRTSKEDIEKSKSRNINTFRAVALAGISCFIVALKIYPIGAVSLSLLSLLFMPIALSFTKGIGK